MVAMLVRLPERENRFTNRRWTSRFDSLNDVMRTKTASFYGNSPDRNPMSFVFFSRAYGPHQKMGVSSRPQRCNLTRKRFSC